jgi:hypothetical protein
MQTSRLHDDENRMPQNPRIEMLDDAMIAVLREKTPAQRLTISNGMWRSARRMIDAVLRKEHPEWSADAIQREVARRLSHGAV